MPEYRAIYDSKDDIPESIENFRDLFVEKDGKFELTGFAGLKTEADVSRVQSFLNEERNKHKETKDRLRPWADLNYDEIQAKLDRIPELEAAAEGKLDDAKIDELAKNRADGMIRTKTAPLERDLNRAITERDELRARVAEFEQRETYRRLEDELRPLLVEAKIFPEFHEDALLYARQHLAPSEDGAGFFAKEGLDGVTHGNTPKDWLAELLERRPRWRPESVGGGGKGSGGGSFGGSNPWKAGSWSLTEQGKVVKERGVEVARRMASAAGSQLGATRPPQKATG